VARQRIEAGSPSAAGRRRSRGAVAGGTGGAQTALRQVPRGSLPLSARTSSKARPGPRLTPGESR